MLVFLHLCAENDLIGINFDGHNSGQVDKISASKKSCPVFSGPMILRALERL